MGVYDQEQGAARGNLCRFLSACYYQPGPEFGEEKVFDAMLRAAAGIDPDLAMHACRLGEEFLAEDPESLLIDYTRLFLGPSHIIAKPYGSVWLEGRKTRPEDSTMAVLELYQEGGFEMGGDFRELPDHVAAELEFLYLLIYRENEALRIGGPESLKAISGIKKRFLGDHLGLWIGPFTAAVRGGARSGFYRELADLTDRFVKIEAGPKSTPRRALNFG